MVDAEPGKFLSHLALTRGEESSIRLGTTSEANPHSQGPKSAFTINNVPVVFHFQKLCVSEPSFQPSEFVGVRVSLHLFNTDVLTEARYDLSMDFDLFEVGLDPVLEETNLGGFTSSRNHLGCACVCVW